MNIKMVDLKGQYDKIKSEIDANIQSVINSTAFINGPKVHEFSKKLSNYLGGINVVPCANGTDALQIALMALELNPGDEIILPAHNYVATAEVISLLKLSPIYVDVNGDNFNIDVSLIEEKISKKTKAIIPVHLYGQCADMEAIMEIAKKYKLFVIEDTAQAIGAVYTYSDGKKAIAGTIGDIGTTSFFPSKNLGCFGDGGAIFISDNELSQKCKMIANHGQKVKYNHEIVGCNSRLDSIQAAILEVKLKYLDEYSKSRQKAAEIYNDLLKSVNLIKTPKQFKYSTHVYHQYTIVVDKLIDRNQLQEFLKDKGVPSMIYYPIPMHKQKAYFDEKNTEYFPITEELAQSVLSLPIHTELTREEQEFIVSSIIEFISE